MSRALPHRSFAARSAGVLLVTTLAACAGTRTGDPVPAEFIVATLEQRLLDAHSVDFDFHITAAGAVEADVRGTCSIGPVDAVLRAHGEFAAMPLEITLATTRDKVLGHTAGRPIEGERGEELRASLLLGLTRMGMLHNVAKLFSGAGPDHREGGVADWVQVVDIYAQRDGTLSMRIMVADQDSGEAQLSLDRDGLPRVRQQTVAFPTGTMKVTERYSRFHVVDHAPE